MNILKNLIKFIHALFLINVNDYSIDFRLLYMH